MSKVTSAGTLLYRKRKDGLEVLIVHPKGPKEMPWSIPKGKVDDGETLEEAARRETWEETGVVAPEAVTSLGEVTYKSKKKQVYCFCAEVDNTVKPVCDAWEIDRAEFYPLKKAEELLHEAQKAFISRLRKHIEKC